MIKECPGVAGIKIEGNQDLCPAVRKITSAGIPVFVQVGLTPQRSNQAESDQDGLGMTDSSVSYIILLPSSFSPFDIYIYIYGRNGELIRWAHYTIQAQEIIDAAVALEKVGAVGLFLTALSEVAAKLVTEQVGIPTIGIGYVNSYASYICFSLSPNQKKNSSGSACSGQIVFQSEMLGYQDPWVPQWHSQYESIGAKSLTAIRNYVREVGDGVFPGEELVQLSFLPPPR